MEVHEACELFPMMAAEEFEALVEDIRANGLREPILLHGGRIIDGRNRLKACERLGVKPTYRTWSGDGAVVDVVVSLNLHRRHLTQSQRAVLALDLRPWYESEAKVKQLSAFMRSDSGKEAEDRARVAQVSPRYVEEAKRLREQAPEKIAAIRAGDLTLTAAKREIAEEAREQKREANRALVAGTTPPEAPAGRYSTIVVDPPWDWGDEGDCDQLGRARPTYATMPYESVLELPVAKLAESDSHLYLWITNRSLPKGFALLERWGFRYVTALTWCKPSIGMGNYFRGQTEHVLFGVKGSLSLLRRDVGTYFNAPRGPQHSSKPTEFYDLVESCSPGPWLEMFSRSERAGWSQWGAEASE